MPNRILREGILSSERMDEIAGTPPVEVTYRRMLSVVDDYGRFSAHPSLVRAAIYPLRLEMYTDADITQHLSHCESAGLIRRYAVNGKQYLEVLDFRQRTRAKRSKYPAPEGQVDNEDSGWHAADTCGTYDSQPQAESESKIGDGDERRRRDNDYPPGFSKREVSIVKREITKYMEGEEPDDNLVFDVIEAAGGASAEDICRHLQALWLKGHKPGKAKGPRTFGWFVAVTRQYFGDLRAQEEARLNPTSAKHWEEVNRAELNGFTDAIELPEH